jgi:hypothetical protein
MTGLYVIFGGLILFATAVGVYDLLAERQHRRLREKEEQRESA